MLPNILVPVERLSVGGYATGIRENTAFTLVFHNLKRRFIVAKKVEYLFKLIPMLKWYHPDLCAKTIKVFGNG